MTRTAPTGTAVPPPVGRVISLGNVLIDITARVPSFPSVGGDVFATDSSLQPGGGFNAMAAAARQGVSVAYAGAHGTGPFGDLARAAMRAEGIEVLLSPVPDADTGWDVAVTDADGERTFITAAGAESALTEDRLAGVQLMPDDVVLVSGYGLLHRVNGPSVLGLIESAPAGMRVVSDPGPLVADIPPELLQRLLLRTTWWSCNEREAAVLTGATNVSEAARSIHELGPVGVVVRLGAGGCVLLDGTGGGTGGTGGDAGGAGGGTSGEGSGAGAPANQIVGFPVRAVDTNGAGDTHVGTFAAALLRGASAASAARRANAAAAIAVTRRGPATAPGTGEIDEFLAAAQG